MGIRRRQCVNHLGVRIGISITLANGVEASKIVVKSVVDSVIYSIIGTVIYNWGSDWADDLWNGISVISIGVNSSTVDILGFWLSIPLSNGVESSIGVVKSVVDSAVYSIVGTVIYYWGSNGADDPWDGISVVSVGVNSSTVDIL